MSFDAHFSYLDVAVLPANALVSGRLDSGTSVRRFSISKKLHIVTDLRKYAHIIPILKHSAKTPLVVCQLRLYLHNSNIGPQIFFSVVLPILKNHCIRTAAATVPGIVILTIIPYTSSFPLLTLQVRHFGYSFAFDVTQIWNDLPDNVRRAISVASFVKKFKTHQFAKAYPP